MLRSLFVTTVTDIESSGMKVETVTTVDTLQHPAFDPFSLVTTQNLL